jgi:iron complex outermembrane receptor protein
MRHELLTSAAPLILALAGDGVFAQAAHSQNAPAAELTEIVVTAEKVTSTAQRIAATINVLDSTTLQRQQIIELKDLNTVLPDTSIAAVGQSLQISIRGIGSNFIDPRADPGVAVSINGLFLDRPLPNGFAFLDVARIENLNGPQGTLYGRNAAGGAVNIVSNQPIDKYEGLVQVTGGAYNENDVTAVANIPVGDHFAVRGAYERDRRDGYIGDYYNDFNSDTARISAQWTPTSKLTLYAEGNYLRTGGHGSSGESYPCAGSSPWSLAVPNGCSYDGTGGEIPKTGRVGTFVDAYQLHVDYDLGWATFTSISGFVGTHQRYQDSPVVTLFNQTLAADNYDYSEEFRLTGGDAAHSGGVAWQAGSYLFTSSGNYLLELSNPQFGAPTVFPKQPQSSEAGFGQLTFGVTDRLRITGGARFTNDRKGLTDSTGSITSGDKKWSYKGGLEYDIAEGKLLYANVSTGFVAGGINGGNPAAPVPPGVVSPVFQPETITAYEVGSKNRFLDNRLELNADFYYYDFHNYQYTAAGFLNAGPPAPILSIDDIGSVTTYGFELNGEFALTAHDLLSASLTAAHGTYGELSTETLGGNPVTGFVPALSTAPPGSPLVNLPHVSGLLGFAHTWNINSTSTLEWSINSKLSTSYHLLPGSVYGDDTQKGYTMTDSSLAYRWSRDKYTLRLWVKNIENSVVNTYGQLAGGYDYGVLPPRTYGASLTARFGR